MEWGNVSVVAAAADIDFGTVLAHLAVVLVVAKIAAESFERMKLPAVLGEILAGIAIGPSALGWVDPSQSLAVLAEIGVIVLLAQVGLEMDLKELRRVGRASLLVGLLGAVMPMVGGIVAGRSLGESTNASLFLGAALAATSVGITARVFGDLHALSSTEARIVLGAAVADDVLGMVILTVVTRVVEEGTVDVAGVAATLAIALAFLAVSVLVGMTIVPRAFAALGRNVATPATIGVVAAAVTFGFSAAADAASLAPIIGAFVAGIALGGTPQHDRIEREFSAIGNVLIPVFFVQIGITTDIGQFADGGVLGLAAILSVIAIVTKLAAAFGAAGTNGDRLLIGLGMLPRGEVGLIFASIGMQVGVFGDDLYAVVLLVVLVTTLIAPPLLRVRLGRSRTDVPIVLGEPSVPPTSEPAANTSTSPEDGSTNWLHAVDDTITLRGEPPLESTLTVLLEAAVLASDATPDDSLLRWADATRRVPLTWDRPATHAFIDLLHVGNHRSWRFVEIVGVAERSMPELATMMNRRHGDASELDPTRVAAFPVIEALRQRQGANYPANHSLMLAGLAADLAAEDVDGTPLLQRLHIDPSTLAEAESLMRASTLLHSSISTEPLVMSERTLAQLADYLGSPINVEKCRLLTEARADLHDWQYSALLDVTARVQQLLAHPELIEGRSDSVEAVRRRQSRELVATAAERRRIDTASASYVLAHEPSTIVRHVGLLEPVPERGDARVAVANHGAGTWTVDIATHDMNGLLARIAATLLDNELDVVDADLATWGDGAVLDSFVVRGDRPPDRGQIETGLRTLLRRRRPPASQTRPKEIDVEFDHGVHPWHTIVTVRGPDQSGLLVSLASVFARAGVRVHQASITTAEGQAVDRFEVSDRHGRKLPDRVVARVRALLADGRGARTL